MTFHRSLKNIFPVIKRNLDPIDPISTEIRSLFSLPLLSEI